MTKQELKDRVAAIKSTTKNALQTVYDALSQDQKKQIVENAAVKELFDRYEVDYNN